MYTTLADALPAAPSDAQKSTFLREPDGARTIGFTLHELMLPPERMRRRARLVLDPHGEQQHLLPEQRLERAC